MAQNFLCEGNVIPYVVAGTAVTSGQMILLGALVGVCLKSGAIGETVQVMVEGVFESIPKATGVTFAVGDKLYWDNTAKNITNVTTSNTACGYAYLAAISAATTCTMKLVAS